MTPIIFIIRPFCLAPPTQQHSPQIDPFHPVYHITGLSDASKLFPSASPIIYYHLMTGQVRYSLEMPSDLHQVTGKRDLGCGRTTIHWILLLLRVEISLLVGLSFLPSLLPSFFPPFPPFYHVGIANYT